MELPQWSPADLSSALPAHRRLLVELRADWCVRCGPQQRVVERVLAQDGDWAAATIDVGAHPSVLDGYAVRTLPAILIFSAGSLVTTLTGFTSAPVLRQVLRDAAAA